MELLELSENLSNYTLLSFYGWWQFGVCLFAFLALMSIWYHIGRKQQDFGQVWLAVSVLCWSISGIIDVYFSSEFITTYTELLRNYSLDFSKNIDIPIEEQIDNKLSHWNIWRSILSLFNSLFILLALPWFRYIPKKLEPLIGSSFWIYIVGLPFLFSLLPTLSKIINPRSSMLISEADVYYSILTLIFLGIIMWSSFAKRRLPYLAWLSFICIMITLFAQIAKIMGSEMQVILFSAIFKTSLIMIFFALALSWVKELSENTLSQLETVKIRLHKEFVSENKMVFQVILALSQKEYNIDLTETHFSLLEKFISKRKEESGEEGWLEIKPKNDSRSGKQYDIQDYNQLKRLINALLDGMYGKGNWSRDIHWNALKDKLFEKSENFPRLIRLRNL